MGKYATATSIESDLVWLIDLTYWESNEKPTACKGYSPLYCEDCEHYDFCQRREEILNKLSELTRAKLGEISQGQERPFWKDHAGGARQVQQEGNVTPG